jgi:hypothetical protein
MQYEIVFKSVGHSCYICLPRTLPVAARTARKMAAPGTALKARRLLTIIKHGPHIHTCTNNSNYKKTVHQYNRTAHKTGLELFYVLPRSRERKNHLKRS